MIEKSDFNVTLMETNGGLKANIFLNKGFVKNDNLAYAFYFYKYNHVSKEYDCVHKSMYEKTPERIFTNAEIGKYRVMGFVRDESIKKDNTVTKYCDVECTYYRFSPDNQNDLFFLSRRHVKRFVMTRIAVNNFDDNWLEYHLDLFETLTLSSMEQNASDMLYWAIVTNSALPRQHLVRLHNMISQSKVSANTNILTIDFSDCNTVWKKFLESHLEEGEVHIQSRIDADDMIAPGIFDFIEQQYIHGHRLTKAAINFGCGYRLFVHKATIKPYITPFLCMANFLVSDNLNLQILDFSHSKLDEYAKRQQIPLILNYEDVGMWTYAFSPCSDSSLRVSNRTAGSVSIPFYDGFFGMNEKSYREFLNKYPEPNMSHGHLVGLHPFEKQNNVLYKNGEFLKKMWKESIDYNDLKKEVYYSSLEKIYEKRGDWLESVCELNGISEKRRIRDTSATAPNDRLGQLLNLEDCMVVIVTNGRLGEYSMQLPAFTALMDSTPYDKSTSIAVVVSDSLKIPKTIFCGETINETCWMQYKGEGAYSGCWVGLISGSDYGFISINDIHYSMNKKGLNVVVWSCKNKCVIDIMNINTHLPELSL